MRSAHISIFDTKLRDGEQAAGCSMTSTQKLRLARQLDALGVDIIEAGFAIVSEDDASAISAIAAEVKRPTIASLARANKRDIEAAARALENAAKRRIHIVLAASDLHLEHELRMTRDQALNLAGESVSHARNFVDEVQYSLEERTRADRWLCLSNRICSSLYSSVGATEPHSHNHSLRTSSQRLGMAVANSIAAITAGGRQVECTINGIGERADLGVLDRHE
jgi:2-isopropylmalate synthase